VRALVVLTGAGVSAESGVPVFRGNQGLWEGHRPEDLATPEAFARDPERVWRWYRWRLDRVLAAEPNPAHWALATAPPGRPERLTVVTQNVDGLHQRAGSRGVLELHGNITRARCSRFCGVTAPSVSVDPAGSSCVCGKGRLRPDVVWFGEALPEQALREAAEAVVDADMVWVVGTSSLVYPAAALPALAAERGIPIVEVNPGTTPLSGSVPYSLRAPASIAVPALLHHLHALG
jgi:NAD-dependent deacetylase